MSRLLLNILFFLALGGSASAQNWMLAHQVPNTPGPGHFNTIHPIDGGGYILGGYTQTNTPFNLEKPFMTRIDNNGNIIWEKTYDYMGDGTFPTTTAYRSIFYDVLPSSDGGFFGLFPYSLPDQPGFVIKTDGFGDTLWVKLFPERLGDLDVSMVAMPDGGVIVKSEVTNPTGPVYLLNLIRLDSLGNTVFDTTYSSWDPVYDGPSSILRRALDGNLYLCGLRPVTSQTSVPFLAKFNPNGGLIWENEYPTIQPGLVLAGQIGMSATPDSGVVMAFFSTPIINPNNEVFLAYLKCDQNGDSLWFTRHDSLYTSYQGLRDITVTENGDILATVIPDFSVGPVGPVKSHIVRYDGNGNFLWEKEIGQGAGAEWRFESIKEAHDHGIVLAGSLDLHGTMFAVHLDSLAENNFNLIRGKAFADSIPDCQQQGSEYNLSNWMVRLEPGPIHTFTDSLGNYSMLADSGDHWVSILPTANIWSNIWQNNCPSGPDSHFVSFTGVVNPDTANNIDFAMEADVYCPLLQVDIVAPFLRRCSTSVYYVNYCNYGTSAATNSYIEVTLDTSLTFATAGLPFTPLPGNTYRFDIGTIPIGYCGDFQLTVVVPCDTVNPGRTHCASAHIFPDSLCLPVDTAWSGASIVVEGECIPGDSVEFTIRNDGTGAMLAQSGVWIVEDDILRLHDSIQLAPGLDTLIRLAGNGSTWACLVDQVENHPGQSIPRMVVEGCGTNAQGGINTGFATQFAEDDLNPWLSIHCMEDVGSYDPNDKRGFPSGRGLINEVLASDEMEYTIRFQNTGTDTAFRVVVLDQIPATFDIGTFVPGPSSHPYSIRIVNGNAIEWTFSPILLPDSSTNEVGSQGFVSFTIRQAQGNTIGTRLENAASIYFDFNSPVITDTALHTIGELLQGMVALDEPEENDLQPIQVLAYPNPFDQQITFDLGDYHPKDLRFELFDLQGRKLQDLMLNTRSKFIVERKGLIQGVYPFRLTDGNTMIKTGKLMITEK